MKKQQIAAKFKSLLPLYISISCIFATNKDNDFVYVLFDDVTKKNVLIKYDSKNNTQKIIPTPKDLYFCSACRVKTNNLCKNMLIINDDFLSGEAQAKIYQYNSINDTFKLLDAESLYRVFKIDSNKVLFYERYSQEEGNIK